MAYITDEDLKTELTAILGRDALAATTVWDQLIPQSVEAGINAVRDALTARGYTSTQAEDWSRALEFSRDIALYWALIKGGATKPVDMGGYNITFIDRLNRTLELADVFVDIEVPDEDFGGVSSGMLENDNDVFTENEMDARLGNTWPRQASR